MKTLKVCLVLALVFIAGVAGGVVATRIAIRHYVQNAIQNPEVIRLRIERQMTRKLNLNARQRVEVGRILLNAHEHLKSLRQEFQPQLVDVAQKARGEISAVLTPEQQKKFEEFQAENQRFLQR